MSSPHLAPPHLTCFAVLLLQWNDTFNNLGQRTHHGYGDEDAIAALCRHYDVPLVSMRAGMLRAVKKAQIKVPSFMLDCKVGARPPTCCMPACLRAGPPACRPAGPPACRPTCLPA